MSKTDFNFHEPSRQSPLGVAVIFVQNLRRAINFFLAVVLVNLGTQFSILGLGLKEWAWILGFFFLILSAWQYWKFFFYVKEANFVVEKGVLSQEKTNVPFARIQNVSTRQNLVQRLLGVVGLKVDTAGSITQEIEIPALSRAYAEELKAFLMERKYKAQAEQEDSAQEERSAKEEQALVQDLKAHKPLMVLSFKDLMRVGLTQNHLRNGLILFAVVNGYIWQFEDYLLRPLEPYLEQTAESFLTEWVLLLPFIMLVFVVVSIMASLITTILRYFNFSFYLTEKGISMQSGLFARNTYAVPYEKIQYFRWDSNPLRALIGFRSLSIKQAGAEAVNQRKLISVPGLKARDLLKILNQQYPDRHHGLAKQYQAHPLLFSQYYFWIGIMPVLLTVGLFLYNQLDWFFYLPLTLYLALAFLLLRPLSKSYRLQVKQDYLRLSKGWIFPRRYLIPLYKVQNLAWTQSFVQKPRGLATLVIHTAAGTEKMPHLNLVELRALYDYLLYAVEKDKRKWM